MRDRFQAEFYDTEDTFDFIVGKIWKFASYNLNLFLNRQVH